jgi:hypothetical protein
MKGLDADTYRAFFVIGGLVLIFVAVLCGYYIVDTNVSTNDSMDVLYNDLLLDVEVINPVCGWTRTCPELTCPSEEAALMTGCCIGCKNSASCSLNVTVTWSDKVPELKKAQRIWLFASADCSTWWQTGFAPYITEPSETHMKNYSLGVGLFPRQASDNETSSSPLSSTLPEVWGAAMITDGCYGDPYRPLVLAACLSDADNAASKLQDSQFNGFPFSYCLSATGACVKVNNVYQDELSCCHNGIWTP